MSVQGVSRKTDRGGINTKRFRSMKALQKGENHRVAEGHCGKDSGLKGEMWIKRSRKKTLYDSLPGRERGKYTGPWMIREGEVVKTRSDYHGSYQD